MNPRKLVPWKRKKAEAPVDRVESPFLDFQRRMNALFDDVLWGPPWGDVSRLSDTEQAFSALTPNVDVSETDEALQVLMDLPGIDEKDVQVTLDDDVLVIRGEKRQEREERSCCYHLMERTSGEFQRTIPVPATIDKDGIRASLNKGVLTVHLPKIPEVRSHRRTINVTCE